MSEAYNQICIRDEGIPKMAFATIFGKFVSRVMQQGDCNAPLTFQRLMTSVFCDFVVRFVHVYLDNIFIYSSTIEEHEDHQVQVFNKLQEAQLYLSRDKVDLYSERMDCLGHSITNTGIHACTDKMQKIQDWRQPHNFHEVQRFLRLMQYLAHFMPDVTAYTSPLLMCVCNCRQFVWTLLYDKCLESIKALACWAPVLKPIDTNNPDPIWVICNSSKSGVGTVYRQGLEWQTCHPTGFLSKTFSSAQQNYCTHEHEMIVILKALIKWEDKLLG